MTVDRIDAMAGPSLWERATACMPSARDLSRMVWGYGWGTLMHPMRAPFPG